MGWVFCYQNITRGKREDQVATLAYLVRNLYCDVLFGLEYLTLYPAKLTSNKGALPHIQHLTTNQWSLKILVSI